MVREADLLKIAESTLLFIPSFDGGRPDSISYSCRMTPAFNTLFWSSRLILFFEHLIDFIHRFAVHFRLCLDSL
jgi:hypothetical protein